MSKKKQRKLKYAPKNKTTLSKAREEDWEREDRRQKFENEQEPPLYEFN